MSEDVKLGAIVTLHANSKRYHGGKAVVVDCAMRSAGRGQRLMYWVRRLEGDCAGQRVWVCRGEFDIDE